jgi:FMN phosphatase YigB (HAD superfamily)
LQQPSIKAIIWDFGQVAFFFPKSGWLQAWSKVPKVKRALEKRQNRTEIEERLFAAQKLFETGLASHEEHRLALSSALCLENPLTWSEFRLGYLHSESLSLNTPLFAAQAAIAKIGMAQAVISNLCPIWHKVLERAGATRHLDLELYSYSEGLAKPSEELVIRAIDRIGMAAEDVLTVDDCLQNLAAASFCGTRIHRYEDNARLAARLNELNLPPQCLNPLLTKKPEPFVPVWK